MNGFKAITTVYSYYLPEVRAVVDRLFASFPHDVFLRASEGEGLDRFHEPVMGKFTAVHREEVPGLQAFAHRYPTAGSEEGIREYLSMLALEGVSEVYMFAGDYEGYREVAKSRGIRVREVPWGTDPAILPAGHWFLSDPSARDGNRVATDVVRAICDAGHRLFYDLSYLGSTGPAVFDVTHPNIAAVAVSFSKSYGLFYWRIGFLFSRREVPALYANKWFKSVPGLLLADRVLAGLDMPAVAARYKKIQARVVADINAAHGLRLRPSDSFLLAHMTTGDAAGLPADTRAELEKFRRGDGWRFCLTRYLKDATS